jgi:hypothetical protein
MCDRILMSPHHEGRTDMATRIADLIPAPRDRTRSDTARNRTLTRRQERRLAITRRFLTIAFEA